MPDMAEDQVAELFDKFRLIQGRELVELLAQYAHEAWTGWTTWMIDKWDKVCEDSGETHQARWIRQIGTPYKELPERDKSSDRDEAMKIMDIVMRHLGMLNDKPDA